MSGLDDVPRYCELCGRKLRLTLGPRGYPWMECPVKSPKMRTIFGNEKEHSRISITDYQADLLRRENPKFNAITGEKL